MIVGSVKWKGCWRWDDGCAREVEGWCGGLGLRDGGVVGTFSVIFLLFEHVALKK